jgi:hypothetical protein
MSILEAVERSLKDFHPKTHRQFVVFNIARRLDDQPRLAKYLTLSNEHPKRLLLEAARIALSETKAQGGVAGDRFFALLDKWAREEEAL